MEALFSGWNWGAVQIHDVMQVKTHPAGTKIKNRGNTRSYQLGIKIKGASQIVYQGEKIAFCAGTVLFLPKEDTEDIDYRTLIVEQGFGVTIFFSSELPLANRPQVLCGVSAEVEKAFLKLAHLYNEGNGAFYPEQMATFYDLLTKLYQTRYAAEPAETGQRFQPALAYMQAHACDAYLDIRQLAQLCHMTEKYFRDSFRRCFQVSPLQYFHQRKMGKIRELIADPGIPIGEVATMTGFTDANYFSRFFRKHFGISPSQFRRDYCK